METILARHSEDLSWFAVTNTDDSIFKAFAIAGDHTDLIKPTQDFMPTHRHYKGHDYRVMGKAKHSKTGEYFVLYGDREGRNWLRPEPMFYEILEDGRFRFTEI